MTSITSLTLTDQENETPPRIIDLKSTDIDYKKLAEVYGGYLNRKEANEAMFNTLVHVICRQGKSKFYGLWEYNKLLDSNRQLRDIDQERCDPGLYVRPASGDLGTTLASRFIVLY
jgi:hypothetical protein